MKRNMSSVGLEYYAGWRPVLPHLELGQGRTGQYRMTYITHVLTPPLLFRLSHATVQSVPCYCTDCPMLLYRLSHAAVQTVPCYCTDCPMLLYMQAVPCYFTYRLSHVCTVCLILLYIPFHATLIHTRASLLYYKNK
ncbi:hypothetical protein J6590_063679 [Homalodisca vitripennis]|nr:hypothetical protein J6590_063679 [Homalodisca vitripennis]